MTGPNEPEDSAPRSAHDRQRRLWALLTTSPALAVLIALLVGVPLAGIGWKANSSGRTIWTSRTVMTIDDPYGLATAGDEGILIKLELLRLKYQGLATTDAIATPVAEKLQLPVDEVLAQSSVTVPDDSLLISVNGTGTSPGTAQRISSAVADELTSYVQNENTTYAVPPGDRFFIAQVDPTTAATPSTASHRKSAADAVGLGILGLVVGFVVTQLIVNRRLLAA